MKYSHAKLFLAIFVCASACACYHLVPDDSTKRYIGPSNVVVAYTLLPNYLNKEFTAKNGGGVVNVNSNENVGKIQNSIERSLDCSIQDYIFSPSSLCKLSAIAVDQVGNFYVSERSTNSIKRIDSNGRISIFSGKPYVHHYVQGESPSQTYLDGSKGAAIYLHPSGIAFDSLGDLFVVDTGNDVIRKISPQGFVDTIYGSAKKRGWSDGKGESASFSEPTLITIDGSDNLYVVDSGGKSIRKIDKMGEVVTFAGDGKGEDTQLDGEGREARFKDIREISIDGRGNLFVVDNEEIRKIDPNGFVNTIHILVNNNYKGENKKIEQFSPKDCIPKSIAANNEGSIYVLCKSNLLKLELTGKIVYQSEMVDKIGGEISFEKGDSISMIVVRPDKLIFILQDEIFSAQLP